MAFCFLFFANSSLFLLVFKITNDWKFYQNVRPSSESRSYLSFDKKEPLPNFTIIIINSISISTRSKVEGSGRGRRPGRRRDGGRRRRRQSEKREKSFATQITESPRPMQTHIDSYLSHHPKNPTSMQREIDLIFNSNRATTEKRDTHREQKEKRQAKLLLLPHTIHLSSSSSCYVSLLAGERESCSPILHLKCIGSIVK